MNSRALVSEAIGTFFLAFGVSMAVAHQFPLVPVVAALTVGLFVYTVGGISGANLNPAVTFGLWSVKKMKTPDALAYIVVQLIAGVVAMLATWAITGMTPVLDMSLSWMVLLAEALGGFLLVFGVSTIVYGKAKDEVAGVIIGGSLLLGILTAAHVGSAGIVNPAVAVALGAFSPMYLLGSIIGGILGAQTYRWLVGK